MKDVVDVSSQLILSITFTFKTIQMLMSEVDLRGGDANVSCG